MQHCCHRNAACSFKLIGIWPLILLAIEREWLPLYSVREVDRKVSFPSQSTTRWKFFDLTLSPAQRGKTGFRYLQRGAESPSNSHAGPCRILHYITDDLFNLPERQLYSTDLASIGFQSLARLLTSHTWCRSKCAKFNDSRPFTSCSIRRLSANIAAGNRSNSDKRL